MAIPPPIAAEFVMYLSQLRFDLGEAIAPPVYQGSVLTQCFSGGRIEYESAGAAAPFGQIRISDLGSMLLAAGVIPEEAAGWDAGELVGDGLAGIDPALIEFWTLSGARARFGPPLGPGFVAQGKRRQLFAKALLRVDSAGQASADELGRAFVALEGSRRMAIDYLPSPKPPMDPQNGIDAPIIYYHEIADQEAFAAQLEGLRAAGFSFTPYERLVRALRGRCDLPENPVVITFDDGRRSQFERAAPVLLAMRAPATFFVLPGFEELEPGHLRSSEFELLRRWGFSVQSHSLNHAPIDTILRFDRGAAEAETVLSRAALLPIGGGDHFAYPFGQYSPAAIELVRASGYDSAVTTRAVRTHYPEDLYQLGRIAINPLADPAQIIADLAAVG